MYSNYMSYTLLPCRVVSNSYILRDRTCAYCPFAAPFSLILDQLGRVSESPITLNCPTTGLLPTLTLWRKSGADLSLVSGGIYEISEELRDRQTATFDNFLRIYQTHQQAEGIYTCTSISAVDGPVQLEINTTRCTKLKLICLP